jgi:hypothetical protein
MKLKTATLLAIFGAAGLVITFALDWIFIKIDAIPLDFYKSVEPFLRIINLVSRFLIMIFFITLYRNQK